MRAGAVLVGSDPYFFSRRDHRRRALAARNATRSDLRMARICRRRRPDELRHEPHRHHRQIGTYTARVLKGEKPADLPVVQSTKFELVINFKTAKALGLGVPSGLSSMADEVIE